MSKLKQIYKVFAYNVAAILFLAIIATIIYFVQDNSSGVARTARGAVVTNGYECAAIGTSILDKGGSAVDAAIAALFCEGVAMPQSMGLGGGFLMTIYIRETKTVEALNAREVAPLAATENMFNGDSNLSTKGGLAVAAPGELKGYWEAYKKYGGKLPWKDLIQPTIDLCKEGILVTEYLARLFASQADLLRKDPSLREAFIDPATNQPYTKNQRVKRLKLAKSLEIIAQEGGDALHNGSLTEGFVQDIKDNNGIISVEDMNQYRPQWQTPITVHMPFNQVLYTTPLPGSGVVLAFIINILNGFLDYSQPLSITNWQRIVESLKYGYGKRTELGDPDFLNITNLISILTDPTYAAAIRDDIYDNQTFQDAAHYGANTTQPEDHGTAHISVLAPNGDAVSVTSTINLYFGAGFMSKSTGIILNDEMDDFSSPDLMSTFNIPPSVANYIRPGKRPLSSMCPSIIVQEDGDVRLVIGAAGGTKITTSVAIITIKNLWFNVSIQDAVSDRRLHHQLFPMLVEFEAPFRNDLEMVNALYEIGHQYKISQATGFSAVTSISREKNSVKIATDQRRPGASSLVF